MSPSQEGRDSSLSVDAAEPDRRGTVPRFGRRMLSDWPLDPDVTYLNHGTVGVAPKRVLQAQQAIRNAIERQPSRFLLRELTRISLDEPMRRKPRLREAADIVASFLGARGDDLVFVDNTTTGANAVLRSFGFEPGDEILVTDFGYGGVTRAAVFAARATGAVVRTAAMPYPIHSADDVVEAVASAIGPRTRVAIVDHVTSQGALLLPLSEIAARCHERGVAVLADGAHAPGAIPLNVSALGVDWYIATLHKWMWVPRSSGILWVAPERQGRLHPAVVSWGLDQGFVSEFDMPGTRDPSPHLTAPAAIALLSEFGVEAVQAYDHALAWSSARRLADAWQVTFETPESLIATMATISLPDSLGTSNEDAARLRDALLYEEGIEVQVHAFRGHLYVRISAQIYNDQEDIDRLAHAVRHRAGR